MKRYIFALFLILLVFSLASCSGGTDAETAGGTEPPETGGTAVLTTEATVFPPEPLNEAPEEMCIRYLEGYCEYYPIKTSGDERCFYLPADADLSALCLYVNVPEGGTASTGGKKLEPGYGVYDVSEKLSLDVRFKDRTGAHSIVRYTFKKTAATSLYIRIDENLGSVEAMNSDAAHQTYCYGEASFSGGDDHQSFDSYMSMRGRGNATWTDDKKGYALTLYSDNGYTQKRDVDVCGMGKSDKWILTANHRDRTLIRNALAYTLAQRIGMNGAIEYIFTDLFVNGEYKGLYILSEKIDRDRVGIPLAGEDSLDGGYLLEFDNYDDDPQIVLKSSKMRVTVNAPEDLAGYKEIERFLNCAEAALNNSRGIDPTTGKRWYDFIDIESFAQMWIVREYSMDYDANVNFHFYYDPTDGKLHAGPAWDFDNSFARTTGIYADPEAALIESGSRNPNCWLTKLMNHKEFRKMIVEIYNDHRELFDTESEDSVYALALRLRSELQDSIDMNFTVWRGQLTFKSWNYSEDMSYDGHFGILTDFIERRSAFWESYIPKLVSQ